MSSSQKLETMRVNLPEHLPSVCLLFSVFHVLPHILTSLHPCLLIVVATRAVAPRVSQTLVF